MTLAATIDLEEATRRPWHAVVVGAGPAGALAARELARRGVAVLLVDRARFPRWKVCGCCLNRRTLATLTSVGLGTLTAECGAVTLSHVRLGARGRQAQVALPGGVALSREGFDAALIAAAIEAGAAFLPETMARLGELRDDGRLVYLRQGVRQVQVSAGVVLAADGLGGKLCASPAAEAGSRIGAGAVAEEAPSFYGAGAIHMACARSGYLGLVRLEDGRLDLAAAFETEFVRAAGGLARAAALVLAEVGWPRVPGIEALAWRGTPALTRRTARVAGPRLCALGDAAGYVEPFTGEGIAWALASAAALAPLVARAWSPTMAHDWEQTYQTVVRRRQYACRAAALLLRHPRLASWGIGLLAHLPGLAAPFVRHLNTVPRAKKAALP